MTLALFVLVSVSLAGFLIGYGVLRVGNGLHSGSGTVARMIVALAVGGSLIMALMETAPLGQLEPGTTYGGLLDFAPGVVLAALAGGLAIALSLSFRAPSSSSRESANR